MITLFPPTRRRIITVFLHRHRISLTLLIALGALLVAFGALQHNHHTAHADVLLGCILSLANAFLGYLFIEKAFRYDSNLFLFISLSGMALRFFLMIGSIGMVLLLAAVHTGAFIGSYMVSATLVLIAEVVLINARTEQLRLAKLRIRHTTLGR
jgi:hypothetical protein